MDRSASSLFRMDAKNPDKLKVIKEQTGLVLFLSAGSSNREIIVRQSGKENEVRSRMLKDSD